MPLHDSDSSSSSSSGSWRSQRCVRLQTTAAAAAAAMGAADSSSGGSSAGQHQPHPQQQQQQQQQQPLQPLQQQQQQQQQQHTPSLELPPLELPPSRSAALWLADMSDAQLAQAAADWGYESVGRPLPEGISLTALAETLPDEARALWLGCWCVAVRHAHGLPVVAAHAPQHVATHAHRRRVLVRRPRSTRRRAHSQVFALDLRKALGYLGLSLAVMAAGYAYLWYWHAICPLWQQLCAWAVIGTGYYGAFQTAVDCARFAFWPSRPLLQDLAGALIMAPALISYEVYRLKYFNHIMCV
jgi:hypothetical protein